MIVKKNKVNWKFFIEISFLFFFILLVILGPIIANKKSDMLNEDRYYPLWKNGLFSGFPKLVTSYRIKIYQIDDKIYYEGVDFYSIFPTSESLTYSPSKTIDNIGNSYNKKNMFLFELEKKKLEKIVFKQFGKVEYSINKIKWEPIPRFLKGEILQEDQIIYVKYERTP